MQTAILAAIAAQSFTGTMATDASFHIVPDTVLMAPGSSPRLGHPLPVPTLGLTAPRSAPIDTKMREFTIGSGPHSLTFGAYRQKFGKRAPMQLRSLAVWKSSMAYRFDAGPAGTFSLGGLMALERRRDTLPFGRGRNHKVGRQEVEFAWEPNPMMRFGFGWQATTGKSGRSLFDRQVLLAAGMPASEQGARMSFALEPKSPSEGGWRLAIDTGSYRVARRDVMALGARSNTDMRANVSMTIGF